MDALVYLFILAVLLFLCIFWPPAIYITIIFFTMVLLFGVGG